MSGETGSDRVAPSPWALGEVIFPPDVMAAIDAHLCACYPEEGCGYVTGRAGLRGATRFVPVANEQDRYHALDPASYPRTARTAYLMHPLQFERAYEEARKAGEPVKVIVHSHADHDAYFSAEDLAFAIAGGLPSRDCAYLVVSVRDRIPSGATVQARKLFALDPSTNTYTEARLHIQEVSP